MVNKNHPGCSGIFIWLFLALWIQKIRNERMKGKLVSGPVMLTFDVSHVILRGSIAGCIGHHIHPKERKRGQT